MVRSIILIPLGTLITALTSMYVVFGFPFFKQEDRSVHLIAGWWARTILRLAKIKVQVIGAENIIDGPQVFMANHQSVFDIFIVLGYVNCQFRWIAKKELFRFPFFGKAMLKSGYIPIDRKHFISAMRSIEEASVKVREGTSVMTFPEGTRSRDGRIQPFKKGVFHLVLKSGVPIVPISLIGTGDIMRKNSLRVNSGTITMVIGKSISPAGYDVENMEELVNKVREVVIRNCSYKEEQTAKSL
jgi:1-acyl-sn-glycerol-3-phosphate acyltransferase